MTKKDKIKSICNDMIDNDRFTDKDINKLKSEIEDYESSLSNTDDSKVKGILIKLKKMGFTGPEHDPKVIIKDLLDVLLSAF